jgi:hypothetical protein
MSLDMAIEAAVQRGGKCLTKGSINSDRRIKLKCARGHIWEAKAYKVIYKQRWCKKCHHIERRSEYAKTLTDSEFREYKKLSNSLRSRLSKALTGTIPKRKRKTIRAISYLGCSIEELKKHLESKFQPGMNWNNYSYKGWHIDHIIPLSAFDLTKEEEVKKACHYTNLQPLWWRDNLKKSDKLT